MTQVIQVLLITDDCAMERQIVNELGELIPDGAVLKVNWERCIEQGLAFLLQRPGRVDLITCWNLLPEREIGQGQLRHTRPARHNEAERLSKCLCALALELALTIPMIVHDGESILSQDVRVHTFAGLDVLRVVHSAEADVNIVRRTLRELIRKRAA